MSVSYWFSGWATLLLAGCAGSIAVPGVPITLDRFGVGAFQVSSFWWVMFSFSVIIYLAVVGFTLAVLVGEWGIVESQHRQQTVQNIVWVGWVMPTFILIVLYLLTLRTLQAS